MALIQCSPAVAIKQSRPQESMKTLLTTPSESTFFSKIQCSIHEQIYNSEKRTPLGKRGNTGALLPPENVTLGIRQGPLEADQVKKAIWNTSATSLPSISIPSQILKVKRDLDKSQHVNSFSKICPAGGKVAKVTEDELSKAPSIISRQLQARRSAHDTIDKSNKAINIMGIPEGFTFGKLRKTQDINVASCIGHQLLAPTEMQNVAMLPIIDTRNTKINSIRLRKSSIAKINSPNLSSSKTVGNSHCRTQNTALLSTDYRVSAPCHDDLQSLRTKNEVQRILESAGCKLSVAEIDDLFTSSCRYKMDKCCEAVPRASMASVILAFNENVGSAVCNELQSLSLTDRLHLKTR